MYLRSHAYDSSYNQQVDGKCKTVRDSKDKQLHLTKALAKDYFGKSKFRVVPCKGRILVMATQSSVSEQTQTNS